MRILYLAQTCPPEPGGTKRPMQQAIQLRRLGHEVTIVTTVPYYPTGRVMRGYQGRVVVVEQLQNVRVIRVWSLPAPNKGVFLRALSFLSFALSASLVALLLRRHDLVIASVPNVGAEMAGLLIARAKRSKALLEVRDPIPENLALIGFTEKSLAFRMLDAYYTVAYRRFDLIVTAGKGMLPLLTHRGIAPERVVCLPHAADPEQLGSAAPERLRHQLDLVGKFVVLYAGSFGRYYDVPNILEAARWLGERRPEVHFVLLGTGHDRPAIERSLQRDPVRNVSLLNPFSPMEVGPYLQCADLLLTSLVSGRPVAYLKDHLPTKVCEYLSVGRPVIAVEDFPAVGRILESIGAGFSVPAHQPRNLADAITYFADHVDKAAECGLRARQYAESHLVRQAVISAFEEELMLKLGTCHRGNAGLESR